MRHFIHSTYERLFAYPQAHIRSEEREGEYWAARRGGNLSTLRSWQLDRARMITGILQAEEGPLVIGDIGCGGGAMLRYFRDRLPRVEGIAYDYDTGSLEDAARSGIRAMPLDLREAGSYAGIEPADAYLLLEILEHLPRPELLLEALRKKARVGIFFSVPNTGYLVHRFRLFFGKVPAQWIVHPGEHLRFWTLRDMRWWLDAQGFAAYRIISYRGIRGLNRLWPSLFAAGLLVYVPTKTVALRS